MDENEMEKEAPGGQKRDWRKYFVIAVSCAAILAVAAGIALAVTVPGRDCGSASGAGQAAAPGECHQSGIGQGGGRGAECDGECESAGTRERPRDGTGSGGRCGGEADCGCGAVPEGQ